MPYQHVGRAKFTFTFGAKVGTPGKKLEELEVEYLKIRNCYTHSKARFELKIQTRVNAALCHFQLLNLFLLAI